MNLFLNRNAVRHLPPAALTALLLIATTPSLAAPGAHGPNGEHLDAPSTARAASALPRVEAKSDAFELVAELGASALVIVVDRYESNEPVMGAKIEVETGAQKAAAEFRTEQGDYAVTDAAMIKTLAEQGEHGLVFTLVAGKDSDLLDGTLVNAAGRAGAAHSTNDHEHGHADHGDGHGHGHGHLLERIAIGVAVLGVIGGIVWWRLRRRKSNTLQGGL
jgi:hypothetical protein